MATAPAHVAGPTYSLRSTLASSSFDSRRFHSNGISAYPALRTHSSAKVRAGFDGESSASQHAESISRPVIRRKRSPHAPVNLPSEPDESVSLQTVMVEDEGVALEGVGTVDRGGSLSNPPWGSVFTSLLFKTTTPSRVYVHAGRRNSRESSAAKLRVNI